jgi:putative membrane-bound dehydrogenase-like protein
MRRFSILCLHVALAIIHTATADEFETFIAPRMTEITKDVAPFEFVDVGPKIPDYTPGTKWGVQGHPKTTMQLPLSVEESMKHYSLPEGMALRLYADERNFDAKPIAMNWDERGRLWICETLDYPNELGQNRDRIRICEDTDGDNVADKFTIFAEGLSIPTAIMIYRGGAVVQNATETLYLKDTDGDDRADLKTVLISDWAAGDTHGGVSNFRYGLDNWIWGMQGYNDSAPEFNGQESQSFRQGFWRFKLSQEDPPKVTDLEFVRSTNNNTWGLGISEEGLIFGSTANHNPCTFVPIPNRYYEKVRGWAAPEIGTIADTYLFKAITENVRQVDQFGGYTAGAGHALYTARTFPQQWWNRTAFVCEPTGHLVGTFLLRRDGTGYTSASPTNLMASDDEWASPIMAEVGPDGAVWVIDWYNFIIQHNPTPQGFKTGKGNAYESDLRDKKHGRIYRVVPTDDGNDKLHKWTSLASMTDLELVGELKHPSMNWRLQAQRLLIERQAGRTGEVLLPLLALLKDETVDAIGLNAGAVHALHTLDGLGYMYLDPQHLSSGVVAPCVIRALSHPSSAVRRNALAVLPNDAYGLSALLAAEHVFSDHDAQVRLQGILCLADMKPSDEAGRLVATLARRSNLDLWESNAVTAAAATHAVAFLEALGQPHDQDSIKLNDNALQTAEIVGEHIARSRPAVELMQTLLAGIERGSPELSAIVAQGLLAGWPRDYRLQSTDMMEASLLKLLEQVEPSSKSKLLRLAVFCGSKALESHANEIVASLLKVVRNMDSNPALRIDAAQEAVEFQPENKDLLTAVLETIDLQTAPDLAIGMIAAAGLSTCETVGDQIVARIELMTPQMKAAAVRVLLSRPATTLALLKAIEAGTLDFGDLTLDQKQALRVHPDKVIRMFAENLMAAGGGLPDANRDRVLESLLPLCEETGDSKVGKAMFIKHCSKCHMHGTEGKTIGPNLTGMAVHPKHELLTHIIDPSRSVEGNFRIYTIVKTDGLIISGMMSGESRTAVTLIDPEAKEHNVAREDIEELVRSRKSVMPEGFEKQMTPGELTSLLEFLTDKGKFMPIALDRYATAISTKGLFSPADDGPDRMIFSDWSPKIFVDIPFILTDPRGKSVPNIILLYSPKAPLPASMPKSVTLPCNSEAKAIHLLSGVGGWSFPADQNKTVSMIVRLHNKDGSTEDIELVNGIHFADYIRRVDVPESEFAFALGSQQIRHITITPKKSDLIDTIELIKGADSTAPMVMAVTVERM